MSATSQGAEAGSSSAVAPRNDSRPSSSPASSSGRTPTTPAAAAKKSSRLAASRAAEVAVIRTRPTPQLVHDRRGTRRAPTGCARWRRGPGGAAWSTPWPSRVMRISRTSVSPPRPGDQQPGRVGAAVDGGDRLQTAGHPPADRVVAAGQVPGVVGVQALHALPGPAHPARRPGPAPAGRDGGVALRGVGGVGGGQLRRDRRRLRRRARRRPTSSRSTAARSARPTSQ